ncbi:hypothetical protein [Sphingomonas morindae]|uniref:Glycosyltransferase RgtA/B/C/D-like domain-containing protein n=1 Tax=Sphingomonas morindae TaxID=1541170 RepID=A0ABY4XBI4_9SPHN|nr:hypothetical protein [Sphingomonas morindae]USI74208.1 hypothetical protein LHA26_07080 [Sphingomonas morindae]
MDRRTPVPPSSLTERRARAALLLLAVTLLAAGLRLWHGFAHPFWLDEAYSAYAADHGFAFLWHVVPRYETHPPFYYSLVRLWSLAFGETLAARRSLGLIAGIAAVPVAMLAARRLAALIGLAPRRAALLALLVGLFAACHPLMLQMSRQVRPYPVMTLVYALALLPLFRLAAAARAGRPLPTGALAGFALAEAAMLWLHSLGPLFGAALGLALLLVTVRPGLARRDAVALLASQALAGLLYLPAFAIMLGQAPTWIQSTWLVFRPATLIAQLGLIYASWNRWVSLIALLLALAGAASLGRRHWGGRVAAALAILAILPVAAAILLSLTVAPVFLTRTLSPVTVPGLLLIAAGAAQTGRLALATLPLAALLLTGEAAVTRLMLRAGPMQDWYGAIAWLRPRMAPGDTLWAYPNEGALPLSYALRDERRTLPIRAIPAPVPAFGMGGYFPTGSRGVVSLYPDQIARLMASPAARTPPTIWVLRLGPWKYDPGDRLVRALAADRRVVGHFRRGAIDLIGLRRAGDGLSARRDAPAAADAAR